MKLGIGAIGFGPKAKVNLDLIKKAESLGFDSAWTAELPQSTHQLQYLLRLGVSSEEHRRVRLAKCHQSRIGRTAAIPIERARRIEAGTDQTSPESQVCLFLVARQV